MEPEAGIEIRFTHVFGKTRKNNERNIKIRVNMESEGRNVGNNKKNAQQ